MKFDKEMIKPVCYVQVMFYAAETTSWKNSSLSAKNDYSHRGFKNVESKKSLSKEIVELF